METVQLHGAGPKSVRIRKRWRVIDRAVIVVVNLVGRRRLTCVGAAGVKVHQRVGTAARDDEPRRAAHRRRDTTHDTRRRRRR